MKEEREKQLSEFTPILSIIKPFIDFLNGMGIINRTHFPHYACNIVIELRKYGEEFFLEFLEENDPDIEMIKKTLIFSKDSKFYIIALSLNFFYLFIGIVVLSFIFVVLINIFYNFFFRQELFHKKRKYDYISKTGEY